MNALTIVILAFSLLGALDWIIGNRFGLGAEFERGFHLFGAMALSMMGMIIIAPALGVWLSPVFDGFYAIFKIDPSVIPAMLFANDMGGASLASEINKSQAIGGYNAFVISSMMGCVISFTIPFASGIVDKSQHGDMFLGFLAGIVTIPVGSIVAGFISGLGFIAIILNLLPMLILSALIVLGLIYLPDTSVRIFQGFGFVIKVLIIVGLGLGIFTFLTHITVYSELEELESAALVCVNACVTLSGAFPFMFVAGKLLRRPMSALGKLIGINSTSALALIPTLVTNATAFGMMRDMDRRGVVINSAFAVSAAFVFGSHLAFTMAYDPSYVLPVIIGKLISGISAVILALFILKKNSKTAENTP